MAGLATVMMGVFTSALWAADADKTPDVGKAPAQAMWIAVLIALVLILAVAVPTFKSPKRSHQD